MMINYIMLNFKTIIVSTSLSLLFGLYSIYGLMEHLEKKEKEETAKIENLKKTMNCIIKKNDETNKKYNILLIEFTKITIDISNLLKNITNLEKNKIELVNGNVSSQHDISLKDISKINIDQIIQIQDDIKELLDVQELVDINNFNMGNLNNSLDNDHGFEILEQSYSNNEDIVKSRSRGTSISEINWMEVTKKFIFG